MSDNSYDYTGEVDETEKDVDTGKSLTFKTYSVNTSGLDETKAEVFLHSDHDRYGMCSNHSLVIHEHTDPKTEFITLSLFSAIKMVDGFPYSGVPMWTLNDVMAEEYLNLVIESFDDLMPVKVQVVFDHLLMFVIQSADGNYLFGTFSHPSEGVIREIEQYLLTITDFLSLDDLSEYFKELQRRAERSSSVFEFAGADYSEYDIHTEESLEDRQIHVNLLVELAQMRMKVNEKLTAEEKPGKLELN